MRDMVASTSLSLSRERCILSNIMIHKIVYLTSANRAFQIMLCFFFLKLYTDGDRS